MNEHTYKKVELTGSSKEGTDQAIRNAITKAAKTIHHMDWFEVVDTRGQIVEGEIAYWQVTIRVGFRLDD